MHGTNIKLFKVLFEICFSFLQNVYIALTALSENDYMCLGPPYLFLYWVYNSLKQALVTSICMCDIVCKDYGLWNGISKQ
jgi:hypothetical protein